MSIMGICIIKFGYSQIYGKYVSAEDKNPSTVEERYQTSIPYGDSNIYSKTANFLPDFELRGILS